MIPNAFGDHESLWSDIDEIEEHAWIDSLPPGVKFPAPNFDGSQSGKGSGDIVLLYEATDFPQQSYGYSWGIFSHENIKLIEGNEQDLLVFDLRVKQDSDSPYSVMQQSLNMYDGKDRWFTPVTSTIPQPMNTDTKNPAFGWNETCPFYDVWGTKFQAGIKAKMKFCFEIPKDSDHFKVTYSIDTFGAKYAPAPPIKSGMAFIIDRAGIDSFGVQTFAKTPTVKPSEPTSPSAESSYVIIVLLVIAVVIGGIIVAILVAKKGSKPPTTVAKTTWKQTTVLFCGNCGNSLKPGARFCGMCGGAQS